MRLTCRSLSCGQNSDGELKELAYKEAHDHSTHGSTYFTARSPSQKRGSAPDRVSQIKDERQAGGRFTFRHLPLG